MRALPVDNLSYPVFISLKGGGSGSGVYINDGKSIYLATAKHVLVNADNNLTSDEIDIFSFSRDPKDNAQDQTHINLGKLKLSGQFLSHPSQDVAIVKLGTVKPINENSYNLEYGPDVTLVRSSKSGLVAVPIKIFKPFDDVLVGNQVFVFGYPVSIGIKHIPQLDYRRPLLRTGIVAGQNYANKSLILDAPIYPGNSGGPVVEVEEKFPETKYNLIGISTQFVPYEETWLNQQHGYTNVTISNSGYSIATPTDFIMELLS